MEQPCKSRHVLIHLFPPVHCVEDGNIVMHHLKIVWLILGSQKLACLFKNKCGKTTETANNKMALGFKSLTVLTFISLGTRCMLVQNFSS